MKRKTDELILYRDLPNDGILRDVTRLLADAGSADKSRYCRAVSGLIETAALCGFSGNLWQDYLTLLLCSHENAYSLACEGRDGADGSVKEIALSDLAFFVELFGADLCVLDRLFDSDGFEKILDYSNPADGTVFEKETARAICDLSVSLSGAGDAEAFARILQGWYKAHGVGDPGFYRAFRVEHTDGGAVLIPITEPLKVSLSDLVGYEDAKAKLIRNTEAFLAGRGGNNCLLYGDAGTGKSSAIKGLLNAYHDRGLRIIELYRHQFRDIQDVIEQIRGRNYKFILYLDDLSFEDHETEYKYLKAVIEGGLQKKPDNVCVYATSNRRHLIREKFSDKRELDDELHASETVQEKLSLAARFGMTVYFRSPDKKEYEEIVLELARRTGIDMPEEELLQEAMRWELYHGGLSGRTATQFISDLLGGMQ